MNNSLQIICCGHAAWDMNFMMDGFPVEDQKYRVENLIQSGGGPAANAASLLSKWGIPSAYAGIVGDDIHGRLIIDELDQWGVNTDLVQIDHAGNTPISAVIVNSASGSRTLLNRRNPSDQPEVNPEVIRKLNNINPAVLHFDGHAPDLSLKLIDLFPDALTVMDAGSLRDSTRMLSAKCDYVICSRRFAEELTGITTFDTRENIQRCISLMKKEYSGRLIVTLGEEGLFYETSGKANFMEAFRVKTLDSTAAGDIFHGAFSYGLLKEFALEMNLRFSSAAAAVSVGREGGKPSIPSLKETEELFYSI